MKNIPSQDLLVVGARDFLKASATIAKFGDETYDTARRVMKRRAGDLKEAFGVPFDASKVREFPKEGYIGYEHDGTYATIGPSVTLPARTTSISMFGGEPVTNTKAGNCARL